MLRRLVLQSFRNYEQLEFFPSPHLSLVIGPNGAGKSSLFEAIYLLSTGRSFRSGRARQLLREGASQAHVFAEVALEGHRHRLGMSRGPSGVIRLRRDGENARAMSELARLLPVRILHPGTVGLVEGPAKGRRHYLDWGLFHVEQSFGSLWRELRQALDQRNRLLRKGDGWGREMEVWSQQVARASARIDRLRKEYLQRLQPRVRELLSRFPEMPETGLVLHSGWGSASAQTEDPEESLLRSLRDDREKDLRQGFTGKGAHRADLRLAGEQGQARDLFSRGQCKILGYLMFIAQIQLLVESQGADCLVLVDDLASELDEGHRDRMTRVLLELGQQTIFSALDAEQLPILKDRDAAMFHVEHGVLRHMPQGH